MDDAFTLAARYEQGGHLVITLLYLGLHTRTGKLGLLLFERVRGTRSRRPGNTTVTIKNRLNSECHLCLQDIIDTDGLGMNGVKVRA